MAVVDVSNHNPNMSLPCFVRPLNPHATPYLKAVDCSVPSLCLHCPEIFPIPSLQLPPVPVPSCYNCTISSFMYPSNTSSFPIWVHPIPPYQLTKYYYAQCTVPLRAEGAEQSVHSIPSVEPCDLQKHQKTASGGLKGVREGSQPSLEERGDKRTTTAKLKATKKRSWMIKDSESAADSGVQVASADGFSDAKVEEFDEVQGKTSLMIKNIPNQLRRSDLIVILDEHCMEENIKARFDSTVVYSEYDFLYLPMDFARHANLGYAFVNFTTEIAAARFWSAFNGFKWQVSANKKTCEVTKALIQGKDGFIKHFKNSLFPCNSNSYLPVVFDPPRDGSTIGKTTVVGKRVARAHSPSTTSRTVNRKIKAN